MNNDPIEIEVLSTNDFEFGINKKRKCKYKIFNPHYTKGLVVYIPGFGADLGEYTEVFCRKISGKFSLATMSVEYFCIHCRPSIGAEIEFELEDINQTSGILAQEQGKDTIEKLVAYTEKNNIRINVNASLKPKKGEYQNFGILAALDTINCIKDAAEKFSLNKNNIILIGSSYGGYIANIATKIFPGLIRAVFDNSSWAQPNLAYVVGRELNKPEFSLHISEKLSLNLFVKSPWTLKKNLPNSFSGGKRLIRSFDHDQVKQMFNNGGGDTFYIFYHSVVDYISPPNEKVEMVKNLMINGFKNVHMEIMEESDIDGFLIKSLDHGMGMSMIRFFERAYGKIEDSGFIFSFHEQKRPIEYRLNNSVYLFHINESPVRGEIQYLD